MVTKENRRNKKMPGVPPEHPWERQPTETDMAWEAFVVYRNLGPTKRSQVETAKVLSKHPGTLTPWSAEHQWVLRAHAYDQWVDRQNLMAEAEARKEMRKRHIQMAMSLQGAAALALNKIIKAEQQGEQLTLKPGEMKELAELGLKIERLNRGEPDSITEQKVEIDKPVTVVHDYSALSSDDLRQLKSLLLKAKKDTSET